MAPTETPMSESAAQGLNALCDDSRYSRYGIFLEAFGVSQPIIPLSGGCGAAALHYVMAECHGVYEYIEAANAR